MGGRDTKGGDGKYARCLDMSEPTMHEATGTAGPRWMRVRVALRRTWRRAPRTALEILGLGLGIHLLLPQLAGLQATGRALARATWWLVPAVLALEAGSLLAYAELVRTVMRSVGEPAPRTLVWRTTLVGNALGRAMPGGSTTALAVIAGALRRAGLDPVRSTMALAASGGLSSITLALLLPPAAGLALIGGHGGTVALGAAGLAVAVVAVAAAARPALRRPAAIGRFAGEAVGLIARGPLQRVINPTVVAAAAERAVRGADDIARDHRALTAAGAWSAANWLLDLAALAVIATTIGRGAPLAALPLAYIVAQLVAAVPLTPGGVGFVEAAMTGTLVAAGSPAAAATATVLGWRLVSHWIPILVGLALLPTLPGGREVRRREGAEVASGAVRLGSPRAEQ
jgi:uncharacterized membrane protein YbhN (UPF0104 family)